MPGSLNSFIKLNQQGSRKQNKYLVHRLVQIETVFTKLKYFNSEIDFYKIVLDNVEKCWPVNGGFCVLYTWHEVR
jgi:hypothetical protein